MPNVPDIREAHDARAIGADLIRDHHPHLAGARILFLFTDQRRKRCDRVRIGSAAKLTAIQRFLSSGRGSVEAGEDFIIMLDSVEWAKLNRNQKAALVDHELCHCALFVKNDQIDWHRWIPEDGHPDRWDEQKWGLRAHDIEEFSDVLARHGFWKPSDQERAFEAIVMQRKMPEPDTNGLADGKGTRRRGTASSEMETAGV